MKYLFLLLTTLNFTASAQVLTDVTKSQIYSKTLLVNGGFENGKQRWTASAGTFAVTGSSPMIGLYHATWDAAASADTLTTTAVTIPAGMYGRNAVASCLFTVASGTGTHEIQAYDGSNVLAESSITSSTTPARTSVNFIMPSSGSIQLRIYANADEPSVAIDDCYLGPAEGFNLSAVSTAQFIGSAYIPVTSLCTPTRTSTSMGAFGSDTDCPGPTVEVNPGPGTIQTTDANGPSFTVNNLPPGRYRVLMHTAGTMSTASAGTGFAIYDGTNTYGEQGGGPNTTATRGTISVEANFVYSTTSNVTFVLHGRSSAGTITLDIDAVRVYFAIYRYPTSNELAYTADQMAQSWSGYHDTTCSWARTNTAFGDPTADATCAFTERTNSNFGTVTSALSGSDKLPGIVFTPKRVGRYKVCAEYYVSSSAGNPIVQMVDGSGTVIATGGYTTSGAAPLNNNCGIANVTSVTAQTFKLQTKTSSGTVTIGTSWPNLEWSIFALDNAYPQPQTQNDVASSSSGGVKLVSAYIQYSAGVPAVTRQNGTWISSITDNGTGDMTLNVAASTFSGAPNCVCSQADSSGFGCQIVQTTPTSATAVRVLNYSTTAAADRDSMIICVGPK